ncbi:4Fe-4S dicluster domain-containing protein [Desulfoscipio geothermicus]|uniref:4Fe-4S binding domain-containing protein n=1 Tax=Desulfoscipio geothermicus DSM 3669 TaxID=1121426 RepID=A0A1I6D198_9FIRM|nr:4Fe-4S binding protein [Desulfoscipio geothermicus]SFQ99249.1 4Fe-4S binding domain-containing protein [Desulfoscipio geothermicus DSM 3669]
MATEIIVRPWQCIGCSTCALTCSLAHHGVFDTGRANIRICRDEFAGTFELRFSSTCNGCKQCARVCPSGALQLVDVPGKKEREVSSR